MPNAQQFDELVQLELKRLENEKTAVTGSKRGRPRTSYEELDSAAERGNKNEEVNSLTSLPSPVVQVMFSNKINMCIFRNVRRYYRGRAMI